MPCTYYESPEEKAEAAKKARDRRHVELDRVTELLCKVCEILESDEHETFEDVAGALADVRGLHAWYERHKERDKERKKK